MKYFFLGSLLVLVSCSMPGVGELEERMDVLEAEPGYDDAELVARMDELEQQFTALEGLLSLPADYAEDTTGHGVRPSIDPAQILLLQESLAGLTDSLSAVGGDIRMMGDSIAVLHESLADLTDSLAVVGIAVDSLTAENEEMLSDIEDLQGELWSLQQAAQDEMSTSGRSTGGTGDRGTGTGGGTSGGRGTGGGTGGGTSGGR